MNSEIKLTEIELTVKLELQGPVISGATAAGTFGIDLPFAKHRGKYTLPGTHLKGRLREAFLDLESLGAPIWSKEEINTWLGPEPKEMPVSNEPERGAMNFGDLFFDDPPCSGPSLLRVRTSIDSDRQAVKTGALLFIESPFKAGSTVSCTGKLTFFCSETNKEGVKSRKNKNLFESDIILSGGVLKGAVATTLNLLYNRPGNAKIDATLPELLGVLGKWFHALRFTHAYPVKADTANERPGVAPLSIVLAKDTYYDIALCDGPRLIDGAAPKFQVDWKIKDWDSLSKNTDFSRLGVSEPPRELRVRTAIDGTLRRAREDHLFGYDMVEPEGYCWLADVDISAVEKTEQAEVHKQLKALFDFGLRQVGKTKATAAVTVKEAQPSGLPSAIEPDIWVVTLQTPALLLEPGDDFNSGLTNPTGLLEHYRVIWTDLSGGSLKLERHFARQFLQGGHLHYRYNKGKPYNPFLLTGAGSVFVFSTVSGKGAEAETFLKEALRCGLKLPGWLESENATWDRCPYVRENGFGEIAVNQSFHLSRKPS